MAATIGMITHVQEELTEQCAIAAARICNNWRLLLKREPIKDGVHMHRHHVLKVLAVHEA